MGKAKRDIGPVVPLPGRAAVSAALLAEEGLLVETLIAQAAVNQEEDRKSVV